MFIDIEITHILLSGKNPRKARVSHVGGEYTNGKPWLMRVQDAVEGMEKDDWRFFVRDGGHIIHARAVRRRGGGAGLVAPDPESGVDMLPRLPESEVFRILLNG